jgi:hypothetical protein
MRMKLYRVTCRGMHGGIGGDTAHGIAYVVSEDPHRAYQTLRAHLDKRDLGFTPEREMQSVELLAEANVYPDCGIVLYLDA